jgi:L-aspartate oxidase
VQLDATALGAGLLSSRFPTIEAACRMAGLDWARESVPITPAAHYWMGGVATDAWGHSSLPGLYAVGEVACTGAHGANRLASNSLLESVVFAHRAALSLRSPDHWIREEHRAPDVSSSPILRPEFGESGAGSRPVSRDALQQLMWDFAGIHRSGEGLTAAASTLERWGAAETLSATLSEREDANLLQLARLLVGAALERRESRGAHFRSDFPTVSDEFARHLTWAREVPVPC